MDDKIAIFKYCDLDVVSKMNIPNYRIPIEQCKELMEDARKICNDSRIKKVKYPCVTLLSDYKDFVRRILGYAGLAGYLTKKQQDSIIPMLERYKKIVQINSTLNESTRRAAISLLKLSAELAEPYLSKDKLLQFHKGLIVCKIKQIENDEYFWSEHIDSAHKILTRLKERKVETLNLEEITNKLMGTVYVKY